MTNFENNSANLHKSFVNNKKTSNRTKMCDQFFSAFRSTYKRLNNVKLGLSGIDVKRAALKDAIAKKHTPEYTEDVFNKEVAERIDLLLSSAHFKEECAKRNLNPFNAATHQVLLGWQKLEDTILRGGYNEIEPYNEWNFPMFDFNTMLEHCPHIGQMLSAEEKAELTSDLSQGKGVA